ncbi:hypothetical protein BH10PAT1_BH10PAT1_1100 [soil metagenome]
MALAYDVPKIDMFDFIKNIGSTEFIILGLILVLFVGSKKITELGKNAGVTVKELNKVKKEYSSVNEEIIGKLKDTKSEVIAKSKKDSKKDREEVAI